MDIIIHMIPFHLIYSWLFKSFRIDGETTLIDRLVTDGYKKFIVIKRSWIFGVFTLWLPITILTLSITSIWIAAYNVPIASISFTIIGGNILMSSILVISSFMYIWHFRQVQGTPQITTDVKKLKEGLHLGDIYFTRFFNWSITNQFILFFTIIIEIILITMYFKSLGDHAWILSTDILIMIMEIFYLKMYRKRMMDLEMDYNIIVPGKVFFVNQSGVLSSIQNIESNKIKTVRSSFPNKIASFFNYGTIDVLTEGDTEMMMGTMSMYYVTDPDKVVASIQTVLREVKDFRGTTIVESQTIINERDTITSDEHALDTREKIRDVLR